jgi:hypothetical protein
LRDLFEGPLALALFLVDAMRFIPMQFHQPNLATSGSDPGRFIFR